MRKLTKKQKSLINNWFEKNTELFKCEDLNLEQIEILEQINDTEILYQEITRYLSDLYLNRLYSN